MKTLLALPTALACLATGPAARQENPVELGRVAWGRELADALAAARAQKKPVLALFQEIPG